MTPKRWIRLRKLVQAASAAAFVALFVLARRGGWPADIVNAPMRLDPLGMAATLISARTLAAGSALALVIVGLTLVFGRAWCGWLCPLGTTLDLLSLRRLRGRRPPPAERWRAVKYVLLTLILVAAVLGNLTLLVLDPLTILFRTLSVSVWPAADRIVSAAEKALYVLPALRGSVSAFDTVIRPAVLPSEPVYYRDAALFLALFAGLVALNALAGRFWCRYLCPLGGLLGLLSKIGLVRRQVDSAQCTGCDACARVCPTGAIAFARHGASDPGECTVCQDCLGACPRGGVTFRARPGLAAWQPYDPNRRQLLASGAAAVAGVGALAGELAARRDTPHLIQPPGARHNGLLSKCIRCGQCARACPTGAIQPAFLEAGAAGLWTPLLIPRAGYCDYSCNACGQICPAQAIPPLSLDDKRQAVIGKAYIDTTRCIAWADHTSCIVCEEMCPLPEKAITLRETTMPDPGDSSGTAMGIVQLPEVHRDRCIGCGICEYKCPVNGQAAIRVFSPTA